MSKRRQPTPVYQPENRRQEVPEVSEVQARPGPAGPAAPPAGQPQDGTPSGAVALPGPAVGTRFYDAGRVTVQDRLLSCDACRRPVVPGEHIGPITIKPSHVVQKDGTTVVIGHRKYLHPDCAELLQIGLEAARDGYDKEQERKKDAADHAADTS